LLERFELPLWLGLAFVVLLLAVACANLAGLSMVRAFAREGELGIRAALGATRGRLIAQLLIESVTLSMAGGVAGLFIAYAIARPMSTLLAGGLLPLALDVTPNRRVIVFAAILSLATGVLFGLGPALRARVVRTPRFGSAGWRRPARQRLTSALVVGQVGVSALLLVIAGLLVGSVRNMHDVDPGFNRENVLLVDVRSEREQDGALLGARLAQLHERVRALPGVSAVSASWLQVFEPFADMSAPLSIQGYMPAVGDRVFARTTSCPPATFRRSACGSWQGASSCGATRNRHRPSWS
jgi:predicted lysophospholipase L1 biosynthesis ABC-type transport system permease subunit